jgi:AcrR family transcriptional regulator
MPKIVVTEQQWIEKGMECFAVGGSEALVIEKMAAAFGCSKSSFYWYFNNRDTFVNRIVEQWKIRATEQVISSVSEHTSIDKQLLALLREMFSVTKKGDFLFYLRKLSMQEVIYRSILDEIELLRMNHVQRLLIDAGLPSHRAYQKAWLLYHYYLGWYERHKESTLSEDEVQQHVQMIWDEWIGGLL